MFRVYTHFDSIDQLPEKLKLQIEKHYFKRSFESIWQEIQQRLRDNQRDTDLARAHANGKYKMCLIFKWYFHFSSHVALAGDTRSQVDFQVHTGPAMGAFNQWVKGTELESWQQRHVDAIGLKMMESTAALIRFNINERFSVA